MICCLFDNLCLFSLSCSLVFGFIADIWTFEELDYLTMDGWWVESMEVAVIWVWVTLVLCFVVFLPVLLLSEVPWLVPILWVYGAFIFLAYLVKPAVMFWPLLLMLEFMTLLVSFAWWFEYLFITIEDWCWFWAAFNSFSLLSSWTFLSYCSMRRWAFWVPLYLEVPVADVLDWLVPDLSLLKTLFEPVELVLLWDVFLG